MSDSKIKNFTVTAYVKGWKVQDKARSMHSAITEHPGRSACVALDYTVARPLKGVGRLALAVTHTLWEPVPWAAKGSIAMTRAAGSKLYRSARRLGEPGKLPVPNELRPESSRQTLLDGLAAAQRAADELNKVPPSVKINVSQYALHVGCMLPLKAAKLLGVAAIVHTTPLGHMALGHLLSPNSEEHLLALMHLHVPEELGIAAGTIKAFHGPFARTLERSNLSEYDRERTNYMRAQARVRKQMQTLRRAVALQDKLAKAPGLVARSDIESLQSATALASTLSAPAQLESTPEAKTSIPEKKPTSELPQASKTNAFIAAHPATRAGDVAWTRFAHYFEKRSKKLRQQADALDKEIAQQQQTLVGDKKLTETETTRATHRMAKLAAKRDLARTRAKRQDIELGLRTAPPGEYAQRYAAYLDTKQEAAVQRAKYSIYKGLEERSSKYVRPNEEGLESWPKALRLAKSFMWYSVAVVPLCNLPYWGVRYGMRRVEQKRLDKQAGKAEALLKSL